MEQLIRAVTQEDGYWPKRVEGAFVRAGFVVRRLERQEAHLSVWTACLNVGTVKLLADKRGAAKQMRKLLAKAGLRIRAGELSVLDQRRNGNVKCAFVFGSESLPNDL